MIATVLTTFLLLAAAAAVTCASPPPPPPPPPPSSLRDPTPSICSPPCKNGDVICTWNDGGNGFNGSTSCQRACGSPVGSGDACKLSANHTCYWGWTKAAGWACFSGPPPCSSDGSVIGSAYLTCADLKKGYGGCEGTSHCSSVCCSTECHCVDLEEDKSECMCGAAAG